MWLHEHYPAMPSNKIDYSYVYRIILSCIIKDATIYCILPHSKQHPIWICGSGLGMRFILPYRYIQSQVIQCHINYDCLHQSTDFKHRSDWVASHHEQPTLSTLFLCHQYQLCLCSSTDLSQQTLRWGQSSWVHQFRVKFCIICIFR